VSGLDADILAEKTQAVRRHLARVADRLPADPAAFVSASDASDSVILHLWQATQIVIDLALTACVHLNLGTPSDYADGFRRLAAAGAVDHGLADRLVRAAGFRNTVAHGYSRLDLGRVYRAAQDGPADLIAFLAAVRDLLSKS
jgi:uncharacterized protein YutE (UPF0331/DUF86 family)